MHTVLQRCLHRPVQASKFVVMSLQATRLARRKAALTKHHGPDDPRTRAAARALRLHRVKELLTEEPLSADERGELATLLAGAA